MKLIVTTILLLAFSATYAQCPSIEELLKKRNIKDEYNLNSQSRTGVLAPEQSYEMSFIAHPGLDYRLTTILADGSQGTLNYEIFEMVVEKKVVDGKETYKKTKKVLAKSGSEALEFSSDSARKIFVNVTVNGGEKKKMSCVAVVVETKRSLRTGF